MVAALSKPDSPLATSLGLTDQAKVLNLQAEHLQQKFEEAFWNDDLGTYVLALDGYKRQCCVRSSNAGHALLTGIAGPERAKGADFAGGLNTHDVLKEVFGQLRGDVAASLPR